EGVRRVLVSPVFAFQHLGSFQERQEQFELFAIPRVPELSHPAVGYLFLGRRTDGANRRLRPMPYWRVDLVARKVAVVNGGIDYLVAKQMLPIPLLIAV